MVYTIVSEIPGRIRIRCGASVFDEGEARGVTHALMDVEGVRSAEVHVANGSVLVVFAPSARDAVLAVVEGFDVLDLPVAEVGVDDVSSSIEIAAENNRFVLEMSRVVAYRVLRRIFLPAPLRAAWTVLRAIGFIWEGLSHLIKGELTVEVLDAAAITTSLVRGQFSEASTVIFLLTLSSVMERHVQARSHLALMANMTPQVESVWQVVDGKDVQISVSSIERDMVLHVGMGSALPVDGEVVDGEAEMDESSMTGESRLVHKAVGSTVFAGTAIESGDLKVRVTAEPGAARIDKIVSLVEDSSRLKAGVQSKAERLADSLVPYSFLAFFGIWAVTRNVTKAITVLMVDYSCAIKFSTPVAVMSAMSEGTRRNIVFKGGKYLEALAAADTVFFDKTGTLTHASPRVERVFSSSGLTEDDVLTVAACIEEHFPHSMARAIVDEAERRGLHHEQEMHADVSYIVAHGIATTVDGVSVEIGSSHYIFEDEAVPLPKDFTDMVRQECPTASIVYLASDHELVGAIAISDPIRNEAAEVLEQLRELGITRLVMLTGDSEGAASYVAGKLGIDEYHAQVLPEDKSSYVSALKEQGHTVVMVGDGVNDSPALATADVSVAMSDASDIARAVADISILDSRLDSLVTARLLSMRLMSRIHRNYDFIVAFNSAIIALGVAGVLPTTTAAYLHNGSTFAITALNARPLLRDGNTETQIELAIR